MGYTTDFNGTLVLSRKASPAEIEYINNFSGSRRMSRDTDTLMELYNGQFGLPNGNSKPTDNFTIEAHDKHVDALNELGYDVETKRKPETMSADGRTATEIYGKNGEFFANPGTDFGQTDDASVIYHNSQPITQPGLWCQWVLSEDGTELAWDGGEKFYNYVEWLRYMIENFFEAWEIKLNGSITWTGEDNSDIGKIIVNDNVIDVKEGKIVY